LWSIISPYTALVSSRVQRLSVRSARSIQHLWLFLHAEPWATASLATSRALPPPAPALISISTQAHHTAARSSGVLYSTPTALRKTSRACGRSLGSESSYSLANATHRELCPGARGAQVVTARA